MNRPRLLPSADAMPGRAGPGVTYVERLIDQPGEQDRFQTAGQETNSPPSSGLVQAPRHHATIPLGSFARTSYVIHVWEVPVPSTLEEADDMLGELSDDDVRKTRPKLVALAKALWERYPRDLSIDTDDPVWADSVLSSGHDSTAVFSLGIPARHLNEVVPFLAETAQGLGLMVVYDMQYGTAYLPSGAIPDEKLPPE